MSRPHRLHLAPRECELVRPSKARDYYNYYKYYNNAADQLTL